MTFKIGFLAVVVVVLGPLIPLPAFAQRPSIASLQARIATLEASSVPGLASYLAVDTSIPLRPTARFHDVNVQVVNGLGSTASVNGLGNVVIGYDEVRIAGASMCSLGTYTTEGLCTANGGTWAVSHKSGSHNLVTGTSNNYSRYGGLLSGDQNTINGDGASVTGGQLNTASGLYASVSAGGGNYAVAYQASVSGGDQNVASGAASSISGGELNQANATGSTISGGSGNIIQFDATRASITGGYNNRAYGAINGVVSGGNNNFVTGTYASIGGGESNISGGLGSTISGGALNTAYGADSSVNGGTNRTASGGSDWVAGALFQDF